MRPFEDYVKYETRRQFFARGAMGLGAAALASLMPMRQGLANQGQVQEAFSGGLPELPHFAPKAKRAIYLFMSGAPSQHDMYDYKPLMLEKYDTDLPESIRMGQRLTTRSRNQVLEYQSGKTDIPDPGF